MSLLLIKISTTLALVSACILFLGLWGDSNSNHGTNGEKLSLLVFKIGQLGLVAAGFTAVITAIAVIWLG